jgi:tetratricopeptide (TPR) repeat protein
MIGMPSESCEGRFDEALEQNRLAQDLEPLSVVLHHHAAWLMFLARRYDEAIEQGGKAIDLDSGFASGHFRSGLALEQQSRAEEAIAALRTAATLSGHASVSCRARSRMPS